MAKHPDYDWATDAELFVVRWHRVSFSAMDHLDGQLTAHVRAVGKPLYYAALIDPTAPQPDEAARQRIIEGLSSHHANMQATRMVILGSGVRTVLVRTGLTAMMMIANRRGHPFKVDKNLRELAENIAKQLGRDVDRTLAWFRTSGLVRADELS